MRQQYSPSQRTIGIVISALLLLGFGGLLWAASTGKIHDNRGGERAGAVMFSLMMMILGISGLFRLTVPASMRYNVIAALLFSAAFAVFGWLFVWAGLFHRESITANIPFIPIQYQQAVGGCVFIGVGAVIILLVPIIYRIKLNNG